MNTLFNYLQLLTLSASGMLLLCIVFTSNPELANGIISGKLCWFHFTVLLFACCILLMEITIKKSRFTFSLPDGLLLFLFGTMLISYDNHLNLQPEKLLFIAQLTMMWFMLRSALQAHPYLKMFFLSTIMFTSVIVSVWSINYLYGSTSSEHLLSRLIEGDVNSNLLFSGYLAIILPLCLNKLFRLRNCDKTAWWETRTLLYYLSWAGFILILITLPGSMDHPAWMAACISCIWVCWMRLIGWEKTKCIIKKHTKLFIAFFIFSFLFMAGIPEIERLTNIGSPEKRILMWNITAKAIMKHPLTGTGLGSFPTVYAKTQSAYFTSGQATDAEMKIAECPNFAYNEYLHMGLEIGIIGTLLFILWLAFSIFYGIKHRQIGSSGGILALAVFAMYSYPLQLPSFWVILVFLSAICVAKPKYSPELSPRDFPFIGAITAVTTCILFCAQIHMFNTYKEWEKLRTLYNNNSLDVAAKGYSFLYSKLSHQSDFLIEGAECLSKTGCYGEAIALLERGMQLSAAPDLYQDMAMNKQLLGRYEEAELYLLDITYMQPKYVYSYYLLSKLYAEPSFFHPDKLKSAAHAFLSLQTYTDSKTTQSMREEIYTLLNDEPKRKEYKIHE